MQLTQFTDFGLRVLMYLTHPDRETLVTIAEMSEKFAVPHHHLTKVVHRLVKLGWVKSTRGRNGGLSLAVAPELLGLGTIIKALEVHKEVIDCNKTLCALTGSCHLKNMLEKGMAHYYERMDEYSLADAVRPPTQQILHRLHAL